MNGRAITAVVVGIVSASCTVDIRPLKPKPKPVTRHHHQTHSDKKAAPRTQTVDANWMRNYKELETRNNYYIPADENIAADGGKYRVPAEVIQHNQDMMRAELKKNE